MIRIRHVVPILLLCFDFLWWGLSNRLHMTERCRFKWIQKVNVFDGGQNIDSNDWDADEKSYLSLVYLVGYLFIIYFWRCAAFYLRITMYYMICWERDCKTFFFLVFNSVFVQGPGKFKSVRPFSTWTWKAWTFVWIVSFIYPFYLTFPAIYCIVKRLILPNFRNLANNHLEGPIPHNISSCSALNQL